MASITTPERNWSGTYTYAAQQIYRPQTISELQQLIATARPSLHALGTRHSFNGVADAAGLITLQSLAGGITIDEDARTVSVPAGIRYGDLARRLQDSGWAVSNLPSLPHISVAGSVAIRCVSITVAGGLRQAPSAPFNHPVSPSRIHRCPVPTAQFG
jgi:xylitol oxidase